VLIGVADGGYSADAHGSIDEDDGNTLDTVPSARPTGIEPDLQAAVRGETVDTSIEFADGSATTDGTFLSEFGQRASRREHPERWGDARVQGAVFGFKLEGERGWVARSFAVRTDFRRRGATLSGCFGTSVTVPNERFTTRSISLPG